MIYIDEHKVSKDRKFAKVIIKLPSSDAQMIMSVFKWGFRYPIVAMNFDLAVSRAHKELAQWNICCCILFLFWMMGKTAAARQLQIASDHFSDLPVPYWPWLTPSGPITMLYCSILSEPEIDEEWIASNFAQVVTGSNLELNQRLYITIYNIDKQYYYSCISNY